MKFFNKKNSKDIGLSLHAKYISWHTCLIYKLNFDNDFLLFDSEKSMNNYIVYNQLTNYDFEIIEVISNMLDFGG